MKGFFELISTKNSSNEKISLNDEIRILVQERNCFNATSAFNFLNEMLGFDPISFLVILVCSGDLALSIQMQPLELRFASLILLQLMSRSIK